MVERDKGSAELKAKSKRSRTNEALQRSEEQRYRQLVETLVRGVQENDCDGMITYSNPAHHRMLGYENGELVGRRIWHPHPSVEEQDALREYLAFLVKKQPAPIPYLSKSKRKDGSLVDLQIDWDYQRDGDGNLKGFISVITDVTDRRKAEEDIRDRTQGLATLVVKAMDLSELVEENAHLLRTSVARTAELNVRLDRSLPAIEADAGQVQQVIMNLITNASEAIGEKAGMITLTTGVQDCDVSCLTRSRVDDVPSAGRFVVLEVSDTGCGMDGETQQRLFDPFYSTKAMGRGLGMSAILGIVRGHGGAIFVDSVVGKSTTIRVLFPALKGARTEKDRTVRESEKGAVAPATSGTVLVVDDEDIVRNVCKEMVEALGMQVLTAVDGRDAVALYVKHADDIDIVILDLTMPNRDGLAAFEELVRIKHGVRVMLSSGYSEQESLQRMPGKGLAGFIQKPYTLEKLRDALYRAERTGR